MIYLGSDHAGYQLKEFIRTLLEELKLEYTDFGTDSEESVDFTDYAIKVAEHVVQNTEDLGILFCGSGAGMVIAANKVKGARAAQAFDEYVGAQCREHDDANILVLAGRVMDDAQAAAVAKAFLQASFDNGENHARRVEKIKEYEEEHLT